MAGRASPVRTCVGCRKRAPASELLRIVAAGAGQAGGPVVLVPDPTRRQPGRGAHLHPDPACLTFAERRRAFGRALRLATVPDVGPVRGYVSGAVGSPAARGSESPTVGRPPHPETAR